MALGAALAACAGPGAGPVRAGTAPEQRGAASLPPARGITVSSEPTATPGSVAVGDAAGDHFLVKAAAMSVSEAVNVDGFLWSAAPGQYFLVDQMTVANPTAAPEPLTGFDDVDTGLADAVAFVLPAQAAAAVQDSADCGVDPAFAPTLCPLSYGQGVTVDSDSVDHDGHHLLTLAPGSSARITDSYGPVLQTVTASSVTPYFTGGASPVDLAP